jgi:hydrogenase expression/formation protein HypE
MNVTLAHGAGGRSMRRLVTDVFASAFDPSPHAEIGLAALDDGAVLRVGEHHLVVTTDAHVVSPAFFPGGDIGRLAICGTVNDLAVMGATAPLGITSAIVIEEGYPLVDLERIRTSMLQACREAHTTVVAGDTKVMGRGEVDGIVITTTGFGLAQRAITDCGLRPGDVIIVTGFVADHGLAVMAQRHKLAFETPPHSDVAPINHLIARVLHVAGDEVTAMKDPTRGGVASALHEMAEKSNVGIVLDEPAVPVTPAARAVSELLGIDPLYVANEGKALIGVAPEAARRVIEALREMHQGRDAAIIGRCVDEHRGMIVVETGFGRRLLAEPEGELLPRIC